MSVSVEIGVAARVGAAEDGREASWPFDIQNPPVPGGRGSILAGWSVKTPENSHSKLHRGV